MLCMSRLASIALLFVAVLAGFAQDGGKKKVVVPAGARIGPNYSPGIQFENTLYVSGQTGTRSARPRKCPKISKTK